MFPIEPSIYLDYPSMNKILVRKNGISYKNVFHYVWKKKKLPCMKHVLLKWRNGCNLMHKVI